MGAEGDRLARAGRYVLGLMDEADRDRAERDLEFDSRFRAAVVAVAERMHLFDLGETAGKPEADWQIVAARIGEMPHMRDASQPIVEKAAEATKAAGIKTPDAVTRIGAHSAPGRQAVMLAAIVAAAFAAGYAAGIWSAAP